MGHGRSLMTLFWPWDVKNLLSLHMISFRSSLMWHSLSKSSPSDKIKRNSSCMWSLRVLCTCAGKMEKGAPATSKGWETDPTSSGRRSVAVHYCSGFIITVIIIIFGQVFIALMKKECWIALIPWSWSVRKDIIWTIKPKESLQYTTTTFNSEGGSTLNSEVLFF